MQRTARSATDFLAAPYLITWTENRPRRSPRTPRSTTISHPGQSCTSRRQSRVRSARLIPTVCFKKPIGSSKTSDCRHRPASWRPLMLRATGNINGPSPGEAADQSADSGAGVPGSADVGILQHGVTKSPHDAIRGGFRLGKNIDQPVSRARIGYIFEAEPHTLQRRDHRGGINRVAHDAMSDDKGARRRIRVAQQDYHVVHELNTGRSGSHGRKQIPVFQDLFVADAAVDLAERRRDAEGRRAARVSHRSIGAGRYGPAPLGMGGLDAVAG